MRPTPTQALSHPLLFLRYYYKTFDIEIKDTRPFPMHYPYFIWQTLVVEHPRVKFLVIHKLRQISETNWALGYVLHQVLAHPGKKVYMQSAKKEKSTMLLDRLEEYSIGDLSYPESGPLHPEYKRRIGKRGGRLYVEPRREGEQLSWIFPAARSIAEARQESYDLILLDEVDSYDNAAGMFQGIFPSMAENGKMLILSTIDDPLGWMPQLLYGKNLPGREARDFGMKIMPGVGVFTNDSGYYCMGLDWECHPERGSAYYARKERALRHNPVAFQREYMRDYKAMVAAGTVFPMFQRSLHVRDDEFGGRLMVIIDFGYGGAGVVWMLIKATGRDHPIRARVVHSEIYRAYGLKKLMTEIIGTSLRLFDTMPVWWVSDHEVVRHREDLEGETRRDYISRVFGVYLNSKYAAIDDGLCDVAEMLNTTYNNEPLLTVQNGVKDIETGFAAGYKFREIRKDEEGVSRTPQKDGLYDHLFDAIRYGCQFVKDWDSFEGLMESYTGFTPRFSIPR